MILYGTNPVAWANDDDQSLGANIPTEQILREAGQIGFDGIENGHRFPTDPEALKRTLGAHGLTFISGWYSTELLTRPLDDEIASFQPHLAKLKHNGCKVCVTCETSNAIHRSDRPLSERPALSDPEMRTFGERIESFSEYMAGQGIDLVYHHHMGTIVETPADIDAFMAATGPATKLLFDAGHYYFGANGGDPAPSLARHAGRVRHFHAKNVRPAIMRQVREENLSFLDGVRRGVFTVPGDPEGGVDFPPLLSILAQAGYEGWLVIEAEQDQEVRNPYEYQSLGLSSLREFARCAGLDMAVRQ